MYIYIDIFFPRDPLWEVQWVDALKYKTGILTLYT